MRNSASVDLGQTRREVDATGLAWIGWIPLMVFPGAALVVRARLAPWVFMWTLAGAIFFGCKWQAWWECRNDSGVTFSRSIGFLFAWPGMDAGSFLNPEKRVQTPKTKEWIWAIAKTASGALLLWSVARRVPGARELFAGWVGMLGMILALHFGTFHILSLAWRAFGVDAQPIMRAPLSATSLSDFWGRRWNLGFRQLTHRLIFQPARIRSGVVVATLLAFFVSGLIHELVISLPARGGYGLPTLYFVLQGIGVLAERSHPGTRLGLSSGTRGRLFAVFCVGAPAYWLFHPHFISVVILPFLAAIGAR
jgi:hypothetical protein